MINEFQGIFRFLSNFWPCKIVHGGIEFPSVEHAYQADKFKDREEAIKIASMTPGQAKRYGKKAILPQDWDSIKVKTMKRLLEIKFSDPDLRFKLIDTYPHELIEGNQWGDTFWGKCNGQGQNILGNLLMEVRREIVLNQDKFEG